MKNAIKKMIYEIPLVEIIEVEVEKGFAFSDGGDGSGSGDDFSGGWS